MKDKKIHINTHLILTKLTNLQKVTPVQLITKRKAYFVEIITRIIC